MNIFAVGNSVPAQTGTNNRRSFLQKLGMGISTAVGSATVMAKPDSGKTDDLARQLATLEAANTLHALHQQYEQAMDTGQMDVALTLFTDDAEVVFNGGVFIGREQGLSRLYRHHFAAGHTGKRMEVAPGFAPAADSRQQQMEVSLDTGMARAVFPFSIQVGRPVESPNSLASMARAQGDGVHTWWEGGVYELTYVKGGSGACWKIQRLAYNTQSRAGYRPGRSYASPIVVPAFAARYPADTQGPDKLV